MFHKKLFFIGLFISGFIKTETNTEKVDVSTIFELHKKEFTFFKEQFNKTTNSSNFTEGYFDSIKYCDECVKRTKSVKICITLQNMLILKLANEKNVSYQEMIELLSQKKVQEQYKEMMKATEEQNLQSNIPLFDESYPGSPKPPKNSNE